MALGDVWGNSWGNSWGSSWQQASTPHAQTDQAASGRPRFDRKPKRRQRVIRFSDYESREAYANALAEAAVPMAQLPATDAPQDEWESAEESLLLFELMRRFH